MELLEQNIRKCILEQASPGVTYGVIEGDKITTGGVGSKTYTNTEDKVDENTLYDIASLTKVVVVVPIISKLVDKGMLSLDTPLKRYLPRFKYDDVTIMSLLSHTSGLPADLEGKEIIPREEVLNRVYASDKEYETGTKVVYSDLGYILLGEMIASIYGKPLDQVAKEEIFEPLNMTSTCYRPSNKSACVPTEQTKDGSFIQGEVHDEKARSLEGVAGNAGVFTTAKDLSNFVSMILNDGMFEGKKFISKDIIDLWFEPTFHEVNENTDRWRSWCWIVGYNRLVSSVDREGMISFNGYTGPSISVDRKNNLGIVLLSNRVHPTRENTKYTNARRELTDGIYKELQLDGPSML